MNTLITLQKFLISTLILAFLGFNPARAAVPPGKAVTPSITLQGGSTSAVKWAAPGSAPYKVYVFVPSTGNVIDALYRVYPKGKRPGSTQCRVTDVSYPCFAVMIDQTQYKNAWVQLTLNGNPETQWAFTKAKGYVAAVADNLAQTTLLNVSTQVRFAGATPPPTVKIGDTYQGGIVFYIDDSGQHGLIAAANDQSPSTGIVWWNGHYVITGATATAVGTGQSNTNKIIAAQGAGNYAATLAANLALNGYSDWFLPSKDELYLMYANIGPGAPEPLTNIGDFSSGWYWSSTEDKVNFAWLQAFLNGQQFTFYKDVAAGSVRAVRAF